MSTASGMSESRTGSLRTMIDASKKPHRSPTQIELYCKCGEAFRRRYVEREIIPPGVALLTGSGMHGAAETNFLQKIESHEDISLSDFREAAAAAFEAALAGSYSLTSEEVSRGSKIVLGEAKDETVSLAEAHGRLQAPDYQPTAVEREARIILPNSTHDLLGYIDLEDDQDRVTDFKTAAKRKTQNDVNSSVQLTFYAAAHRIYFGRDASEVRLDALIKNKEPVRQVVAAKRTRPDFVALVNRVNAVQAGIKAGVFAPATPQSWWCAPKWCGYHATCPYVNSDPVVVEITLPGPVSAATETDDRAKSTRDERELPSDPTGMVGDPAADFMPAKRPKARTVAAIKKRLFAQSDRCHWCGKQLTKRTATLEHVLPLAQGGANVEENYALACKECNGARGDSGLDPKHLTNGATK